MEIKKNKSADLEEGRVTRLLIALVFILSSILVALEYNTGGGDDANLDEEMLDDVERDIEMMPVTHRSCAQKEAGSHTAEDTRGGRGGGTR